MYKVLLYICTFCILSKVSIAQDKEIKPNASIDLVIKNSPPQKFLLRSTNQNMEHDFLDSAMIGEKGGIDSLHFDLLIKGRESHFNLGFNKKRPGLFIPILAAADHLHLVIDFEKTNQFVFSGSVCTQEFYNYTKQLKNILGEYPTGRYAQNIIALKAGCADSIKLKSEIDSLERLEGAYIKKTVLNTQCAYLAVIALMNSQNGIANYRQDEMSQLRARFRDSKQVQMQLDMNQKLLEHPRIVRPKPANGTYFTSFTLPNAYGKKINLEQFKGKFVLIDCWASWCAPCRKESPFLRKSLEQFGKNNLVIISVSIDENRKSWLKAIERDGTSAFVHLIDDNGWKSLVLKQNNIDAIPANFLLSPDVKILEKDLRGEKLVNTLSQILQTKTDVN